MGNTGRVIAAVAAVVMGAAVGRAQNQLALEVPGSVYIRPGDSILLSMDASSLGQPVSSCQAFLNFSSFHFLSGTGEVVVAPGGGTWEELIYDVWDDGGDLDMAVGLSLEGAPSTTSDGSVAKITLTAKPGIEGQTTVVFRPDPPGDSTLIETTIFSEPGGGVVWPDKVDSPVIIIDGTAPSLVITSAVQSAQELLGTARHALQGVVTITVNAADPLSGGVASGLAVPPAVLVTPWGGIPALATLVSASGGQYTFTWTVTAATPNGLATVAVVGQDRSGNVNSSSRTFEVNKNRMSGTLAMDTLRPSPAYQFNRPVVFTATDAGGAVLATWTNTVRFTNTANLATATYLLEDVPAATARLAAKSAWSLRRRLPVTLDSQGQGLAAFTGAAKLAGGDVNGNNLVNLQDYNIVRLYWLTATASADINGDGVVNLTDYNVMRLYWFAIGDPP